MPSIYDFIRGGGYRGPNPVTTVGRGNTDFSGFPQGRAGLGFMAPPGGSDTGLGGGHPPLFTGPSGVSSGGYSPGWTGPREGAPTVPPGGGPYGPRNPFNNAPSNPFAMMSGQRGVAGPTDNFVPRESQGPRVHDYPLSYIMRGR